MLTLYFRKRIRNNSFQLQTIFSTSKSSSLFETAVTLSFLSIWMWPKMFPIFEYAEHARTYQFGSWHIILSLKIIQSIYLRKHFKYYNFDIDDNVNIGFAKVNKAKTVKSTSVLVRWICTAGSWIRKRSKLNYLK